MKTYRDVKHKLPSDTVTTLGFFDGVHRGHAAVISRAAGIAKEEGLSLSVFTFSDIPKNMFLENPVPLISDMNEKKRLIRGLGADFLLMPDFTAEIMTMSPVDFFNEVLVKICRAKHLVCGFNYSFGAGGAGDTALLTELCNKNNVGLTVVSPVMLEDKTTLVSSTAVREAIKEGDVKLAKRLLGREFSVAARQEPWEKASPLRIRLFFEQGILIPKPGIYKTKVNGQSSVTSIFYENGAFYGESSLQEKLPVKKSLKINFIDKYQR